MNTQLWTLKDFYYVILVLGHLKLMVRSTPAGSSDWCGGLIYLRHSKLMLTEGLNPGLEMVGKPCLQLHFSSNLSLLRVLGHDS